MADDKACGYGDNCRYHQRREGHADMLCQAVRDSSNARPVGGICQPVPGLSYKVHTLTALVDFTRRVQGVSSLPMINNTASITNAKSTVAMTPTATSPAMPRWKPSVISVPRFCTPISAPIVTRPMVDTDTTRNPAMSTGVARGRSTCQNSFCGA